MSEKSQSPIDALLSMIDSRLADVNVCLPGIIMSYSNGKATVLPQASKRFADGDVLAFPAIHSVKVCWPSFAGGSAGIKGPVQPGDKCLIVFSQQATDGSDDARMFDLQDAYVIMCDLGNAGAGDSGNNDDLTVFFGDAHIRLTASGELKIHAPGGTTIDTPGTVNTGTLTTQGQLSYLDGMSGQGGSSGTVINGDINHQSGSITSLGNKIDGSHIHQISGGGVTLPPSA